MGIKININKRQFLNRKQSRYKILEVNLYQHPCRKLPSTHFALFCSEIWYTSSLSSVYTTRVHGPCSQAVETARVSKMTPVFTGRVPCSRAVLDTLMTNTAGEHGCHFLTPVFSLRPVNTARGHGQCVPSFSNLIPVKHVHNFPFHSVPKSENDSLINTREIILSFTKCACVILSGCIHDTAGCQTGCQTGLTTGLTTGCIV